MTRAYQITAVAFFLLSALIVRESLQLPFYTPLGPGGGFFPVCIAACLATLSVVLFFQATFQPSEPIPPDFFPTKEGYVKVAAIILSVAATVVLLVPIGFRLTMLAFLLFLLVALGRVNLIVTLLVALAGSFGAFYVFDSLLKVPLPVGTFGI